MPGLWRERLPSAWALLFLPFLQLWMPAAPTPHRGPYKPVIVVHGLFDSSYNFRHLLDYVNEVCPGTAVGGCWNIYSLGEEVWAAERQTPLGPIPRGTDADVGRLGAQGSWL